MASPDHESIPYITTQSTYSTDTSYTVQHSTDGFWDIGNFKNVVRRVDDSAHLCDDLVKLISERAHIEQRYAFKLNEWSRKWGDLITKSQEYGSMKETWHASLVETMRTAEVHLKMNNRLVDQVMEEAKIWKRDKFHKSILGWKETRRIENGFVKAQKPWAVLYGKVQRARKTYYQASKSYFSLCQRIDELENTVGYSLAKVQKEKVKVLRVEGHLHRAQIKYKTRLDDLHNYQEQYIIDMTREYDNWQEMERERLHSFIQIFEDYSKALDITQFQHLDNIYEEFDKVIQRTSPEDDLTWFAQHHGKDMPRTFPQYEEYPASSDEVIQMTDQKVPSYNPSPGFSVPPHLKDPATSFGEATTFGAPSFYPQQEMDIDINLSSRLTGVAPVTTAAPHQYDIPEVNAADTHLTNLAVLDEPDEWAPPRPKEIGTKMRARYDFEAEEDDDLAFKAGDIITVFGEEKDGWMQATLSGEVGYAPFEYLEPVPSPSPAKP